MKNVNIFVEYECTPIRHLVIECPKCNNKFLPYDICTSNVPEVAEEISDYVKCECPICSEKFDLGKITENYPDFNEEFYKGVKKKVIKFE